MLHTAFYVCTLWFGRIKTNPYKVIDLGELPFFSELSN